MKKLFFVFTAGAILLIASCKKESASNPLNNQQQYSTAAVTQMMSYGDVVNNNGILEFASVEDLRTTIAALYNNQEYNIENY